MKNNRLKRYFSAMTALAVAFAAVSGFVLTKVWAAESSVSADKTAQWTKQEAAAAYDLRVHGWTEWETAAYMGFTLPNNFNADETTSVSLVLTTISAGSAGTAYLYAADYDAFSVGTQYEGTANAPSYTETELMSFTNPTTAGEFAIDVTDYIQSIDGGKIAFRIDVKSQNTNNNWNIGSCTNSAAAPKLVFTSGGGGKEGIQNGTFTKTDGWTISNSDNMRIEDGKLTASGSGYEAKLSQLVSGLKNGTYNLNAYVTNDTTEGVCYLYAKTKGHTMASTAVPVSSAASKIVVPNVIVEDGKCDIGLYIKGSNTLTLDNVTFSDCESTRVQFLKGGEISKLTYLEEQGPIKYKDADGNERDCLQIMAENGFNLARIRLLDNPGKGNGTDRYLGDGGYYLPGGYMNRSDCLDMARRARDKGMQIELTLGYSDYWVDGGTQIAPAAWLDGASELSGSALADYYSDKIYEYTKTELEAFVESGIEPEFISIGNEMQLGMCFGLYNENNSSLRNALYNNAAYLKQLVNSGAKAVREVCPNAKIILHSDNGGLLLSSRPTFVNILSGTDFDVIGVSYYPYYNPSVSIDTVVSEFATLINRFDKDVIIMETGYNWQEKSCFGDWDGQLQNSGYYQSIYGETKAGQKAFLTELYAKLKQVLGGRCIGDMYWDPVMAYDGSTWEAGKGYNTGWAIKASDDTTDINVVTNSCLFDEEVKALPAFEAMKHNADSSDKVLITGRIKDRGEAVSDTAVTINVNNKEYDVTTDAYGEYIIAIDYPKNEKIGVTAKNYGGSYYIDAPYNGVLASEIDFPTERSDAIPTPEPIEKNALKIVSEDIEGGVAKYIVETNGVESGVLIAVSYENGALYAVKTQDISGGKAISVKIPDENSKVKLMLWTSLGEMRPLCGLYLKQ